MPNYFAPAFWVEISGQRLTADISCCVEQISIIDQPGTADTFSMTVANPYPLMPWTHNPEGSDLLFQPGKVVKIALGYVDDPYEMIYGEITTISPTFPDSGVPTVVIAGKSLMHRLQSSLKTRTFLKMTDKQIVEKIATEMGLEPEAEDAGIQYDYVMQPNHTDLEFIRRRAARIHFEVLVKGKKLIFRKIKEADDGMYTLVWGHAQQAMSGPNTFPLKHFNPTLNAGKPFPEVNLRGWDPATKSAIVGKATTTDQTGVMGSSTKAGDVWSSAFQTSKQYVRVTSPVGSEAEAQDYAKAILNDYAIEMITGEGATIGLPLLRAGKNVQIEGLGPLFNGQYLVTTTTHTLDGSGYATTFQGKKNSTS
jgi:phage protein D